MKNIIPTGEEVKIISYSKNYDTVVDLTPRSHTNLIRNQEVVQLFANDSSLLGSSMKFLRNFKHKN